MTAREAIAGTLTQHLDLLGCRPRAANQNLGQDVDRTHRRRSDQQCRYPSLPIAELPQGNEQNERQRNRRRANPVPERLNPAITQEPTILHSARNPQVDG